MFFMTLNWFDVFANGMVFVNGDKGEIRRCWIFAGGVATRADH